MSGDTVNFTDKGKIKTDWKTVGAVLTAAVLAGAAWMDIRSQLNYLIVQSRTTVQQEDLERFGNLITLHNPTLHLDMPKAGEYMRRLSEGGGETKERQ